MPPIRVLIFPAGEYNSVELYLALSRQVNVELYGASSVERLGHHFFSRYRNDLPKIADASFLECFNAMLQDWRIDLAIPTHDTVVEYLSNNREKILTRLLLPDQETADACRDKSVTMQIFSGMPFAPGVLHINYEPSAQGRFRQTEEGARCGGCTDSPTQLVRRSQDRLECRDCLRVSSWRRNDCRLFH